MERPDFEDQVLMRVLEGNFETAMGITMLGQIWDDPLGEEANAAWEALQDHANNCPGGDECMINVTYQHVLEVRLGLEDLQ
jgi:hypothetical protein